MRKLALFVSLCLLSISAVAQSSPQMISEVNVTSPKPGMTAQWEAGRKRHSDFHAAQKDTWKIYVWEVVSGDNTGSYMMASPAHNWKDFDDREAFDKIDVPDVAKNMGPYSGETTTSYYVFRDELSLTKPPATPAKMRTRATYSVIPEHVNDFLESIKKINAAVKKTNYPMHPSRWYSLANGGSVPTYVLITDRDSWADMEPTEKKLEDALKEADGDASALDQLRKSCSHISTDLSKYRPDLSYVPK